MEKPLGQVPANCLRVVLFGPESTGKTTLSKALASHYNAPFVPEFAREFLQNKWNQNQTICSKEDLIPIAIGQMKLENEFAQKVNKVLICDTNLLQTKVYSEVYFDGYCDPEIELYSKKNHYDLYFLCGIDVPWEEDVLRDKPNEREFMFNRFQTELNKQNLPYVNLYGSQEKRFLSAIAYINELIDSKH
jgi:NadR type nicotinamide-nucleotide adenylyltransferase